MRSPERYGLLAFASSLGLRLQPESMLNDLHCHPFEGFETLFVLSDCARADPFCVPVRTTDPPLRKTK
jgi:hypothetical protein